MNWPIENLSKSNASSQLLVIKKPNKNFWKIPTTLPSKKRKLDRQNIIFSAGNQRTKDEQDVEDTEGDEVIEAEAGDTTEETAEGTAEVPTVRRSLGSPNVNCLYCSPFAFSISLSSISLVVNNVN